MLRKACLIVCMMATTASADWLLEQGDLFEFYGPNPPYSPESFQLEVTYGYGLPENTIGKGAWIQQAGLIDLSNDPGLPGFLQYATNGLSDRMTITVSDPAGAAYYIKAPEWAIINSPYALGVDLIGLTVTRIEMNVWGVFPAGSIVQDITIERDCAEIGLNFWGTPEPSSVLLLILGLMVLPASHKRLRF